MNERRFRHEPHCKAEHLKQRQHKAHDCKHVVFRELNLAVCFDAVDVVIVYGLV